MSYQGLPLIVNCYDDNSQGFTPAAICNVAYHRSDYHGLMLSGIVNYVEGGAQGLEVAGFMNYVEEVDGPLVQIGLFNRTGPTKAPVLQIGLFNKTGNQVGALINIRGMKSLTDIIKNAYNRLTKKVSDQKSQY
ncbi:MAG: hypothetical protein V1725_00210 [archaeon]